MSIRLRICLCFLLLIAVGFFYLVNWLLDDIRPRLLGSIEESLVDTSSLLAALVSGSQDGPGGDTAREPVPGIDTTVLDSGFPRLEQQPIHAAIYDLIKEDVDIRVYVTDRTGRVIYDSDGGRDVGADYSRWNDVYLTLRGEYGARTTRSDPHDPETSTMVVASPILDHGEIAGVLSVCKPTSNPNRFIEDARQKTLIAGIAAAVALILVGIVTTLWITHPIRRLTRHARAIRDGERTRIPDLGDSEIGIMGRAMEEMRRSLEGKKYVERFVQTLTHEIKAPVAAIRGAAELLQEEMPADRRARFASNIDCESRRIESLVDRLLLLASIESRSALRDVRDVDLGGLIEEILAELAPMVEARRIEVRVTRRGDTGLRGERFLLRHAVVNVLQNAIEFTPEGGRIAVAVESDGGRVRVSVTDSGPGIPEYALARVFERFYSLRRPDTGRRSSGLGLSFAREVAELHGGSVSAQNGTGGGARVVLDFAGV